MVDSRQWLPPYCPPSLSKLLRRLALLCCIDWSKHSAVVMKHLLSFACLLWLASAASDDGKDHLCVLVHGLHGTA